MTTCETQPAAPIDWRKVAQKAVDYLMFAGLVGAGIHVVASLADNARFAQAASSSMAGEEEVVDSEALEAAQTLGVNADASADEIRAALRARLGEGQLHPDHGGDGEEAKRLIAAKNPLIERLAEVRL